MMTEDARRGCSEQRMLHTSELQLSASQLCSHRKSRLGFVCTFQKHCSPLIQTWEKLLEGPSATSQKQIVLCLLGLVDSRVCPPALSRVRTT